MGCGASVKGKDLDSGDTGVGRETWATKTDPNATSPPGAGLNQNQGKSEGWSEKKTNQPSFVLQDAEDDDEIEFLTEGQPKPVSKITAENSQEAPLAAEADPPAMNSKAPPALLSKRQQEEAAKLAEQRKKFDKKYQKETPALEKQRASQSEQNTAAILPMPASMPRTEMVMGLNLNDTPDDDMAACLPGGVFGESLRDDDQKLSDRSNKRDGFDDDDEKLMKEILDSMDPSASNAQLMR